MGDSITLNRNQLGMITSIIAILVFAWSMATDYNARGARIDKLEYQIQEGRAQRAQMRGEIKDMVNALQAQAVEFARLRAVIQKEPRR